jgi:hypothetical protein
MQQTPDTVMKAQRASSHSITRHRTVAHCNPFPLAVAIAHAPPEENTCESPLCLAT